MSLLLLFRAGGAFYNQSFTFNVIATDQNQNNIQQSPLTSTVSMIATNNKSAMKIILEYVGITLSVTRSVSRIIQFSGSIINQMTRSLTRTINQTVHLQEVVLKSVSKQFQAYVTMITTQFYSKAYLRTFINSINVTTSNIRKTGKSIFSSSNSILLFTRSLAKSLKFPLNAVEYWNKLQPKNVISFIHSTASYKGQIQKIIQNFVSYTTTTTNSVGKNVISYIQEFVKFTVKGNSNKIQIDTYVQATTSIKSLYRDAIRLVRAGYSQSSQAFSIAMKKVKSFGSRFQ